MDLQTLQIWMRRLDEQGDRDLRQTVEPVNRYPDFVRNLVRQLKRLFPTMNPSPSGGNDEFSPGIQGIPGTSTSPPCRPAPDSGCHGSRSRCRKAGRAAGGFRWRSIDFPESAWDSRSLRSAPHPSRCSAFSTESLAYTASTLAISSRTRASSSGAAVSRRGASVGTSAVLNSVADYKHFVDS